jgi:hypothetical protein
VDDDRSYKIKEKNYNMVKEETMDEKITYLRLELGHYHRRTTINPLASFQPIVFVTIEPRGGPHCPPANGKPKIPVAIDFQNPVVAPH